MNKNKKIFVAGHNGHVGSAIIRRLKSLGYKNILTISRKRLDLLDQKKVLKFLKNKRPKIVIIAAARVGGIIANNDYRAEFIYQNLTIQNNLIHGSYLAGIKNLVFLSNPSHFFIQGVGFYLTHGTSLNGVFSELEWTSSDKTVQITNYLVETLHDSTQLRLN